MDYAYDGNGNLSQKITTLTTDDGSDSTTLNYTFDIRGQLQQITSGGSSIGQFLYDSNGQRLRALFNDDSGTQISYRHSLYQGLNLISQYDVSGTDSYSLNANYQFNPEQQKVIGREAFAESDDDNNTQTWYHTDALGSVLATSKRTQTIAARYDYDAWGNEVNNTDTSDNPIGYTGHQMDRDIGLIYANARYLDPDTGRFLSFDPFEGYDDKPVSLNKYLYAYQNPLVYTDPDGQTPAVLAVPAIEETIAIASGGAAANGQYQSQGNKGLVGEPGLNGPTGYATDTHSGLSNATQAIASTLAERYLNQLQDIVTFFVSEGVDSPNTELVPDIPENKPYTHPADEQFNKPRLDVLPVAESLPTRMETPYHEQSPEDYILATPDQSDLLTATAMYSERNSEGDKRLGPLGQEQTLRPSNDGTGPLRWHTDNKAPSWTDTLRRREWKRIYESEDARFSPEELQEIKDRGYRGPQRINDITGELETMELSHEPTPWRDGGTEVVPKWPDEHAATDPHRKLKNRN